MILPSIPAIQLGELNIQSQYARPTTAIVEVAPEPYNPILNQEELEKIIRRVTPLEPVRAKKIAKLEPKPIPKPKAPQRAVKSAPAGWYPAYQCTWWVWTKRPVPGWNNASDWLWQAKRDGWTTSSKPVVGAIGWEPGHVVYIEAVNGSTVTISECNYDGAGSCRTTTKPASRYTYIY
jgi:hypothetical protein